MKTQKIKVEIEGIAPLLQHKFDIEGKDAKSKRMVGSPDYKLEGEKAAYKLDDGTVYEPESHIIGCMIKASTSYKIQGRGKKTYKDLIKSAVFIEPLKIVHKLQKYEIDAQAVVIMRARVIRYRPRFDKWALEFTLINNEPDQLDTAVLKQILSDAGVNVGIGDYRPRYGRFIVTKFEEIAG